MIKASDLKALDNPGYRLRAQDASSLTLDFLKDFLARINDEAYGLPLLITEDQIKSGNLFNSAVTDCLVISNAEHPNDYFKYCLTLRRQGKMASVTMQYFGVSPLSAKAKQTEDRRQRGGLGNALANALTGVNEEALHAEYEYYDMLKSLFEEVFQ